MEKLDMIVELIRSIGEDPFREGLKDTPKRVLKSYEVLFSGYKENVSDIFRTFDSDGYSQLIILKDIEMYSMCEHHMLPFFGKVSIGYIPKGRVIGISKLARIVNCFARRLQTQERLAEDITCSVMKYLKPLGVGCIIKAQHFCMLMRGVQKQNSIMVTSSLKGVFLQEEKVREEFLELIK